MGPFVYYHFETSRQKGNYTYPPESTKWLKVKAFLSVRMISPPLSVNSVTQHQITGVIRLFVTASRRLTLGVSFLFYMVEVTGGGGEDTHPTGLTPTIQPQAVPFRCRATFPHIENLRPLPTYLT